MRLCGATNSAREAAFRPYYFFSQTRKSLCIKDFRYRSRNLTPILTHYKPSQTWLGWLTERRVHNSRKLFGFIILDLDVDIHRNFAVLVTCEVLNSFGIDRGIYQIGDICVAKLTAYYCGIVHRQYDFGAENANVFWMACPHYPHTFLTKSAVLCCKNAIFMIQ